MRGPWKRNRRTSVKINGDSCIFRLSRIDAFGPVTQRAPGNQLPFYFIVYCSGAAVVVDGLTFQEVDKFRTDLVEKWIESISSTK